MEVTSDRVRRVPLENIRVSLADFGRVWALAEGVADQVEDYYFLGVAMTCEWLADQAVPSRVEPGTMESPRCPASWGRHRAMPETIDEEYLAALRACRSPMAWEAEMARGVVAALDWAWNGHRDQPPVPLPPTAAAS
jgi:hypothetical protein